MTLDMVPADVLAYGAGHDDVAGQVETGTAVDGTMLGSMISAYGPVGTVFAAAVATFQVALQTSGTQVAGTYHQFAGALRAGTQHIVGTDGASAGPFAGARGTGTAFAGIR